MVQVTNVIFRYAIAMFTLLLFIATANAQPVIIQKPILFDQDRIDLTREYRQQHYNISQSSIEIAPQMIVLHWTSYATFEDAFDAFYPDRLKTRPDIEKESELNVSAHFLVDRDGTIYQLMPTNWMARHIIGLNTIAIGIENVGGVNGQEDLTPQQVTANVALIRHLVKQYPNIQYLIGHFEYERFRGSNLWLEKDPNYFTLKVDPGPKFMKAVRDEVKDLKLTDQPAKNTIQN